MSCWSPWVIVLGMAKIATHASDVAMAVLTGTRASSVNAGTMITPPPTPNKPDSIPATTPIPANIQGLAAS